MEWNNTFTLQNGLQFSMLYLNVELGPAVQCKYNVASAFLLSGTIP